MTSQTNVLLEPTLQVLSNPSHLKRTTCDLCRERKVRCDRGKPQCGRCVRTGQPCTYPSAGSEVARFTSELRSLQSRLRQAESKLREQDLPPPETNSSVSQGRTVSPLAPDSGFGELESWDATIDFDPLEGLLDPDMATSRSSPNGSVPAIYGTTVFPELPIDTIHASASPVMDESSPIPHAMMDQLCQNYHDLVYKTLPFLPSIEFRNAVTSSAPQYSALQYAIAMAGAGVHDTTAQLEHQCYLAARLDLERAETEMDHGDILNLESVQALILIARFEFSHAKISRGLMTLARLTQLVQLLGLDRLDAEDDDLSVSVVHRVEDARRAFWMVFLLHAHATAIFPGYTPIEADTIHTCLTFDEHDTRFQLSDIPQQHPPLSGTAIFILAMRLAAEVEQHHRSTVANCSGTGAPNYNFCLQHARIETMIRSILETLSNCTLVLETDKELRVLALVITFGAQITLYNKAAIANVKKASFLGPVAGESRKMGLSAANAMCDVLLQADVLNASQIPIYRAMSIFLMRPLALAAEIQLYMLQTGSSESGVNVYYTNREIRHSLEVSSRAMTAFRDSMGQYDGFIRDAQVFLEHTQFGNRFSSEFGRKRPLQAHSA